MTRRMLTCGAIQDAPGRESVCPGLDNEVSRGVGVYGSCVPWSGLTGCGASFALRVQVLARLRVLARVMDGVRVTIPVMALPVCGSGSTRRNPKLKPSLKPRTASRVSPAGRAAIRALS